MGIEFVIGAAVLVSGLTALASIRIKSVIPSPFDSAAWADGDE